MTDLEEYMYHAVRELRNPHPVTILNALDTIINTTMFITNANYIDRDILDAHSITKTLVNKLFLGAPVTYKTVMNVIDKYKYGVINFDSRDKRHIIPNIIIILLWKCCGFGGDVAFNTYISNVSRLHNISKDRLKFLLWLHIGKHCWNDDFRKANIDVYKSHISKKEEAKLKEVYIKNLFLHELLVSLAHKRADTITPNGPLSEEQTSALNALDQLINESYDTQSQPLLERVCNAMNDQIKELIPNYKFILKTLQDDDFNKILFKLIEQGRSNEELLNYTKTIVFKRLKKMEADGFMDPDLEIMREIRGQHWNQ